MPDRKPVHVSKSFRISFVSVSLQNMIGVGDFILLPPGSSLPEMCKWNGFAIDSRTRLCEHAPAPRENIFPPLRGQPYPCLEP